jgi:protein-histidine pros-kinase
MDQPITLVAEALHIELMLINVLNNAVRVTPAGGIVYVRLWNDESRVYCAISDGGPGLPASVQERLFTVQTPAIGSPFYGGVGLTISNIIAQCYGGEVELHRSDASGSEFRFWLPLS